MTGAENLMNTLINSLSMIDRGFTVTLTVTPHNWDVGCDENYDEEEDDDEEEPSVSDEIIEDIKEFARRVNDGMSESLKSQMLDHYEQLVKDKYPSASVLGSLSDDEIDKELKGNLDVLGKLCPNWPKVGDEVWYKTSRGNHERGKVKVVCYNTIQLDNNATLERKDCLPLPFNIGNDCWLVLGGNVLKGIVTQVHKDNAHVNTKQGTLQMPYARLFDSVDDLLGYLKSTAYE